MTLILLLLLVLAFAGAITLHKLFWIAVALLLISIVFGNYYRSRL